jgi:hypothetical protein
MRPITLAIASALLITTAGAALADLEPTNAAAIPQMQPIVLGAVTATTAHTVNVSTTDGEVMTFDFDSRTVKPADLAEGTPVRVEFKMLDSGMHLAQRITPLVQGSHDYDVVMEQRAARVEDESGEPAENHEVGESAAGRAEDLREQATATHEGENRNDADVQTTTSDVDANATTSKEGEKMPRTASELPLVLSLGMLLLVVSAGLWLWRRRDTT